ncbi:uncharacterized protein Tco025E_05312 [Trypanosoma conorhini]|uniref:Uncharacterized protein n=1 Tax=Trypanosoma conorhini TaxID=83891 RepID=A0A422PE52_9TRYP|nr:uncharacterized protein Tco025E_05312 [Trypanosoma conorhini]RNF16005.1 hypothetical protein Tco025E_05312 [Trypanosoma conorhini]
MPTKVGGGGVEWGPATPPPRRPAHAREANDVCVALRREGWELGSNSVASSGSGGGDSDGGGKGTAVEDRVRHILSQWEERETRAIVNWGNAGVKSEAYLRIRRLQAIEQKQQEEMRQRCKKLKRAQQEQQRQREERVQMASNARARRQGIEAASEKNITHRKASLPQKPRSLL